MRKKSKVKALWNWLPFWLKISTFTIVGGNFFILIAWGMDFKRLNTPEGRDWLKVFAPAFIATIALGFTASQYIVARNRLRLDLFNKRLDIYKKIKSNFDSSLLTGAANLEEMKSAADEAEWICPTEVWQLAQSVTFQVGRHQKLIDGEDGSSNGKFIDKGDEFYKQRGAIRTDMKKETQAFMSLMEPLIDLRDIR